MLNIDQIGAPAFLVSVEGPQAFRYIRCNDALERQTGLRKTDIDHKRPADVLPPETAAAVCARYTECAATGVSVEYETELRRETTTCWRTTLTPIFSADGTRVERLFGLATNITASRSAITELQVANTRLTLAMQALKGAHWHLDPTRQLFEASPSLAVLLGEAAPRLMSSEEWIARILPEDQAEASLHYLLDGTTSHQVAQFRFLTPAGETRWLRCRRMVLDAADGQIRSIYGVTVDVTEEMLREKRLTDEADQDTLTPLLNRRAFLRHLAAYVAESENGGGPLALVMLDLDGFKAINDTLGHSVGDAVLVEVAHRLRGAVRSYDVCARLGGDEFVVAVRNMAPAMFTMLMARINRAIEVPFRIADRPVDIRVSLGEATWTPGIGIGALLDCADKNLYLAKHQSAGTTQRNRIRAA